MKIISAIKRVGNYKALLLTVAWIFFFSLSYGQQSPINFDLEALKEGSVSYHRKAAFKDGAVYLDRQPGDGFIRLKDFTFKNGIIEADIKGNMQQSFVGIAFHGVNDSLYDAIYFRPFNFHNPAKKDHGMQYISHPKYTWDRLRNDHPGMYEHTPQPVPDPNDWFHVRIEVKFPVVKVYVNEASQPSLTINQLSTAAAGWVGFWVGNYSDGHFKNLRITPTP